MGAAAAVDGFVSEGSGGEYGVVSCRIISAAGPFTFFFLPAAAVTYDGVRVRWSWAPLYVRVPRCPSPSFSLAN